MSDIRAWLDRQLTTSDSLSQLAGMSDGDRAMMLTQGLRNNGDLDFADPGLDQFVPAILLRPPIL